MHIEKGEGSLKNVIPWGGELQINSIQMKWSFRALTTATPAEGKWAHSYAFPPQTNLILQDKSYPTKHHSCKNMDILGLIIHFYGYLFKFSLSSFYNLLPVVHFRFNIVF